MSNGIILPSYREAVENAKREVERNKVAALEKVQSEPLVPCRFCGGPAEWCLGERGDGAAWDYIACADCEAVGPPALYTGNRAYDAAEQLKLWNQSPVRGAVPGDASEDIGWWLSVALDDPAVCDEMKDAINKWFSSGQSGLEHAAERRVWVVRGFDEAEEEFTLCFDDHEQYKLWRKTANGDHISDVEEYSIAPRVKSP